MTGVALAAAAAVPPSAVAPEEVLLYVPNLIGYGRILSTVASFVLMIAAPSRWAPALFLYVASFVGDLVDGLVARKLKQTSTFGGLLDMVTDRCSTLGLLYILSGEYMSRDLEIGFPLFRLTFLGLIILDISSHWCQMYSTCSLRQHHKSKDGNVGRNILVRWFYEYYYFFGYLCVGAEFTYIFAYMIQHIAKDTAPYKAAVYALRLCLPGCVMKQIVNLAQLTSACYAVAKHDAASKQD